MKRKKSLKHSIAYQLFLDYGEPSSMPTALVKSQEVKRFTMSHTAAPSSSLHPELYLSQSRCHYQPKISPPIRLSMN